MGFSSAQRNCRKRFPHRFAKPSFQPLLAEHLIGHDHSVNKATYYFPCKQLTLGTL
jgi:hypothetical protein